MANNQRAGTLAVVMAVSSAALLFTGIGATASSGQATDPSVEVEPTLGTTAETFTATGSGCTDGIVTVRVDLGPQHYVYPDAQGAWTWTEAFPSPVGLHDFASTCSDQSTAGAPTTFAGPGDLRFAYEPVEIETLSTPSMTAVPELTAPEATPQAPAAVPTQAAANYTG